MNHEESDRLERQILGGILRNPPCLLDVATRLHADDFRLDAHQRIYAAMLAIWDDSQPVDLETTANHLHSRDEIKDIGGYQYLAALWTHEPTGANTVRYADLLRDAALLRQLRQSSIDTIGDCEAHASPAQEILEAAERRIFALTERSYGATTQPIAEPIAEAPDNYERRRGGSCTGTLTNFIDLDIRTGGLRNGEMIVLAARPSVGKSALAGSIVRNVAGAGVPVFWSSMEMSANMIADRMVCQESRIDLHRWTRATCSQDEVDHACDRSQLLSRLPVHLDCAGMQSMLRIAANARRLRRKADIRLIVIDYLQLIEPAERKNVPRWEQVGAISRRIKSLAVEMDCPVLALSQLNRDSENRERPRLADLRESGNIEADADVVLLMHKTDRPNIIEVDVAKNRNGPTGIVPLVFIPQFVRFENYAEEANFTE